MAMRVLAGLALLAAACEGGSGPVAPESPHADHVERVELLGASAELRIGSSEAFLDGLDGGHEVFRAVRRGQLVKLKGLVAEDSSLLQRRGHMGRTPLYAAVESGNVAMVEMLLEAGADPNPRRERQDTPLFPAPSVAIVDLLLKHGADLHARDFSEREAHHWAAQFARPDVLRRLLKAGGDPSLADKSGQSPLHWAVMHVTDPKALECVVTLVEAGADVKARDHDQRTALHHAAKTPDMSQKLVGGRPKYDPGVPAAMLGIVELLLERGAAPDATDAAGTTPLDIATGDARLRMEAAMSRAKTRVLRVKTRYHATRTVELHYRASPHWNPIPHVLAFNGVDTFEPGSELKLPSLAAMLSRFGLPPALSPPARELLEAYQTPLDVRQPKSCSRIQEPLRRAAAGLQEYLGPDQDNATFRNVRKALAHAVECERLSGSRASRQARASAVRSLKNRVARAVDNLLTWARESR